MKKNISIIPTFLAGGTGTRLWPQSRKSYPKQFSKILGSTTLFQHTAKRIMSDNQFQDVGHITLANESSRFIIKEQLEAIGLEASSILIEPASKNTGPALLAACFAAKEMSEDPIMLVMPTDHKISDEQSFIDTVYDAIPSAERGHIVTFGVKPHFPSTGYGYVKTGEATEFGALNVEKFLEKPRLDMAEVFAADERYYWNAGIFLFKASVLIAEAQRFMPNFVDLIQTAYEKSERDLGFLRLDAETWAHIQNISIDYAVMEKTNKIVCYPLSSDWSDLGDWAAIWDNMDKDPKGNALSRNAHELNCENSLLYSSSGDLEVVGCGLKDVVAVAMPDAVLVCDRNDTQSVREVVKYLKSKGVAQAETYPKDYRPWGWYESLAKRDRFQVKRILVNPGAALSLQSHHHRSEHWIVVEGTARVTIDNDVKLVTEGESVYIPLGAVHRMENPGKVPMVLIEVQVGAYLQEDDIVRYEDVYARS